MARVGGEALRGIFNVRLLGGGVRGRGKSGESGNEQEHVLT